MQSHLQQQASIPEGPAAPAVCRAAECITQLSTASNTTGWNARGLSVG